MKKLNLFLFCLCLSFVVAHAAVPSRIVYQGRLSKSGVGAAGRHTITVQFVDKDGTNLPYSQTFDVDVPSSGDFSLEIDHIPADAEWINGLPKMRVLIGSETLSPDQTFSAAPYALVARNVENLTTEKVKLAATNSLPGSGLLSSWQSPDDPTRINSKAVLGPIEILTDHGAEHGFLGKDKIPIGALSPTQTQGTALVLTSTVTQTVQPTQPVVPLVVKGQPNTSPSLNMFEVWDNAAAPSEQFHIQGSGNAYFKGNVGIGFTDPNEKLEVNGNIRLNYGNKKIIFSDPGNYDFSIDHNGGTSLDIRSPENDITIASFSNNGNVGIGINTPMAKLHASTKLVEVLRIEREGTTPAQYGFQIQPILNGDSSDLQILAETPGTGMGFYSRDAAGTAILGLGINQNGNVGINKLAPTKALDVVGDANITGNFSAPNISAGTLGIAGSATAESLIVSGPASVGTLSSTGNVGIHTNPSPFQALDVSGNANISGMIRGATFGFGGMYSTSDVGSSNVNNNPLTGGKSCPAGFTPYHAMRFRTAEPEAGADLYICIK